MAGPDGAAPRRPYVARAADECKERAEQHLDGINPTGNVGGAIAWALLAVAAELHIIRKTLRRG
ncbi:hypothetical protein [Streptomyces sp. bgisy154]|uniref:hypothetical protein n=1 Tax=Streptomyces sp. bgisy154 TaxID=3413794 RepID=UPI003D745D05